MNDHLHFTLMDMLEDLSFPAIVITLLGTAVSNLLPAVSSIDFLKALIHPRYFDVWSLAFHLDGYVPCNMHWHDLSILSNLARVSIWYFSSLYSFLWFSHIGNEELFWEFGDPFVIGTTCGYKAYGSIPLNGKKAIPSLYGFFFIFHDFYPIVFYSLLTFYSTTHYIALTINCYLIN